MMPKFPRARKSLGQHFLADRRMLRRIAESCAITPSDTVVEIGPGRGHLTRFIADYGAPVYCLELDDRLVDLLREEFRPFPHVRILHHDCLTFDLRTLGVPSLKIVGNIPYYLSAPLLERLFLMRGSIRDISITVQKEFAQRLVAAAGSREYGSLSVFSQYHCACRILFHIKRGSFTPAPGVDSSFVRLEPRQHVMFEGDASLQAHFFNIVRAAFGQRRKMLRNALKGAVSEGVLERFFSEQGIRDTARGEILTLEQFASLAAMTHTW
jgi:16S rRNA (adenine1518-N6/adenine1519-N6)-dimethyltransferase